MKLFVIPHFYLTTPDDCAKVHSYALPIPNQPFEAAPSKSQVVAMQWNGLDAHEP